MIDSKEYTWREYGGIFLDKVVGVYIERYGPKVRIHLLKDWQKRKDAKELRQTIWNAVLGYTRTNNIWLDDDHGWIFSKIKSTEKGTQ